MTEEMKFFIYLTEYYAAHKNKKTREILEMWEEAGITQKIYNNYWIYHTERIENAYEDIDSLIETGQHKW